MSTTGQTPRRIAEAFLALIGLSSAIDSVCESEFRAWIDENEHRALLPPDKVAKYRDNARMNTLDIMRNLKRNLFGSFLLLLTAGFLALVASFAVTARAPAISTRALLGLSSAAAFAWATLAKLGWRQQSYDGRTIFETLDRLLFRALYWLGTLLATLSFLEG